MKAVVIGGSGHIGTYLIPRLVEDGYEVVSITRGQREPYTKSGMWNWVEKLQIDRSQEEAAGNFGKEIAALKPDIVVDLIAFNPESVVQMTEALYNNVEHYLFCSSIWVHGPAGVSPASEDVPPRPFGEYGIDKAKCEAYLLRQHRTKAFPTTIVRPGHITGPGWDFINPCGNKDQQVFGKIGRGEKIYIANFGMECLHHVHADDVAQVFHKSIIHRNQALGESFHAVAPAAITMRGLGEKMYLWFGREPNIEYLPWKEWCAKIGDPQFIASTQDHVLRSDNYTIEKAERLIGYRPRYTIFQAVCEGVVSLIDRGEIGV
jgi:nucleoside-diphosphate-sugar epimerase